MIIKLLRMLYAISDFDPSIIFYDDHWHMWTRFNGTRDGYMLKEYTKLGEWFTEMPQILQIFKVPYYIITWIGVFFAVIFYAIISLFLTKNLKSRIE